MPPKQRITREMILDRAFAMFCENGMEVVNARSVAKALNCSTQPIFSYYTGMQDLKDALDLRARELFAQEIAGEVENPAEAIGLYARLTGFACAYPHIYRHLSAKEEGMEALHARREEVRAAVMRAEGVDAAQADALMQELYVYCCGLAALAITHGEIRAQLSVKENAQERIAKAYSAILAAIK